eukprot:TRINITY_DN2822_c2_g3_i1.p1 TRINITY_DN2822_c2_g3~~TRINITY_DN2822_c2_g3_i1.p1  ORF type:complete len:355 (+),score=138.19 TRINITY_DN2822_c2_g3_i1:39-1067(+)
MQPFRVTLAVTADASSSSSASESMASSLLFSSGKTWTAEMLPESMLVDFDNEVVLGDKIGEGGFANVHVGTWKKETVAIKKLKYQSFQSEEAYQDFLKEVRLMGSVVNDNVVGFKGVCVQEPNVSIVMEFLPNGSLYDYLHVKNNTLSEKQIVTIARGVARGMHFLHSFDPMIVHRDLKSHNILLDDEMVPKITDFGMARVREQSNTMTGNVGTPQWMSPELLVGEKYDETTDVYSFAMVLWEMITGEVPFAGKNAMQIITKMVIDPTYREPLPEDLNNEIRQLVTECWAPNAENRPSFKEVFLRLDNMAVNNFGLEAMAEKEGLEDHVVIPEELDQDEVTG